MKISSAFLLWITALFLPLAAPAVDASTSLAGVKAAFIQNYAEILAAEYNDSLELARRMQTNVEVFLRNPGAESLAAARQAWIDCREPYLQSEVGRFYDGPIEGVEGFINAWPIDENYLDYTVHAPDAGIINELNVFPQITQDVLVDANAKEGEKTISTGFHAIEFLLWGQDLYKDSAGRRAFTDYVESAGGPGRHAARRREYLHLLTQLLVQHLQIVANQWTPNRAFNYRARLLTMPPDDALTRIFTGLGNLSSSELSGERLLVPYTTKSQENEHSCFSDTTHLDLVRNEVGIQDVFLGRYVRMDGTMLEGAGLGSILEQVDSKLAAALRRQLAAGVAALRAIPPPFDQAILGADSAPGRVAIKKSLAALHAQNASILNAARVLHIQLNLK